MPRTSYSIQRFKNTDCLVNKDIEIRKKKEFTSDAEIEKYGKMNGYDYITICPRTVYFKRIMSDTVEEIDDQLNKNKTNPRYARCTVIKITRK